MLDEYDSNGLPIIINHDTWTDTTWPGKPQTSVLFDENGKARAYGTAAGEMYNKEKNKQGWKSFQRFKTQLCGMCTLLVTNITKID